MEDKVIPLSVPNLSGEELRYVSQAITSEWVSTAGPYITQFENSIAKYVKVTGAAACQSGTAGIHLSLLALDIQAGEEVIVPTLTFIAAVNPIRYIAAEPVFMDCDSSLTIDPEKLENFCHDECKFVDGVLKNRITGRKISAIIVVHVFGNMADMERIMKIAKEYHLKVIEDATEALGSYYMSGTYAGYFAGTIGDIGVYSFNGNKIITTGGGGMIVSNKNELVERCRFLSTQAKRDSEYFVHDEVGYNYRMTNLQAAVGLAQLNELENFIKKKRENYQRYIKNGVPLLPFRKDIRSNYWFYSFLSKDRDGLIKYLKLNQIQSRPIWQLIHMSKPYLENQSYKIDTALSFYNKVVNIPCSTNLDEDGVNRVSSLIVKYEEEIICS